MGWLCSLAGLAAREGGKKSDLARGSRMTGSALLKVPGLIKLGFIKSWFYYMRDQKPNMFMISGFSKPWSPVFLGLNIPKYFKRYEIIWKHFCKFYWCVTLGIYKYEDVGKPF